MTQEEQYQHADMLTGYAMLQYLKTNNLDYETYMQHRIHVALQPTRPKVSRRVKAEILKKQGGRCVLCCDAIRHGDKPCFDSDCGDVLCSRCMLAVRGIRGLLRRGIAWEQMKERVFLT